MIALLKKWTVLMSLLSITLFSANTTKAFTTTGPGWAASQATFHTSPVSNSGSGLSSNAIRDAFIVALSEWSNNTNFNYLTTNGSANPCTIASTNINSNQNGYTFSGTPCSGSFGSTDLAIAVTWRRGANGDGDILQSGIVFNTSGVSWGIYTGNQQGSTFDFTRVAVHELGHSLGLGHTGASAIMFATISNIETLQTDDINGAAFLYGPLPPDDDDDGILNANDNCPNVSNADQADFNNDGEGDVCDNSDDDSHFDNVDNCPTVDNESQTETGSASGVGDACDPDDDGIRTSVDNCPNNANPGQENLDNDSLGDVCDDDADGDNALTGVDSNDMNRFVCSDNDTDTCDDCSSGTFNVANDGPDTDGDGECNASDIDDDNDGVNDDVPDNCQFTPNPGQEDSDDNGIGDACDGFCVPIKVKSGGVAVFCL